MLKLKIIQIGKDKDSWISDACNHYLKLLGRYAKVELLVLPEVKNASALPPAELKQAQGKLILARLDRLTTIALSDDGQQFDSPGLARFLEKLQVSSGGTVAIVIGGAYGLSQELLDRADWVLSLSPLTFSHQLVRPILLEQLYRAFSITAGTDYHK